MPLPLKLGTMKGPASFRLSGEIADGLTSLQLTRAAGGVVFVKSAKSLEHDRSPADLIGADRG
jgi:hypothetical protein